MSTPPAAHHISMWLTAFNDFREISFRVVYLVHSGCFSARREVSFSSSLSGRVLSCRLCLHLARDRKSVTMSLYPRISPLGSSEVSLLSRSLCQLTETATFLFEWLHSLCEIMYPDTEISLCVSSQFSETRQGIYEMDFSFQQTTEEILKPSRKGHNKNR